MWPLNFDDGIKRTTLWVVMVVLATALSARADANALYGIHWWGHTYGNPVDSAPAVMLQSQTYGAWDVEAILTHSDYWWKAWYFEPLYATMATQYNVSVITRIDYKWGETIPAPSSPDSSNWTVHACGIMGALGQYCHLWILGNEPNLLDEGHNWTNQQVTPQAYAATYRTIHNAITNTVAPSPRGPHKLLVAGVSPGPVQPGVRWMDGTNWLDAVLAAIPSNEIDGVAIHAYGGTLASFHNDYVAQLQVLDRRGLRHLPVYLTEFNKYATPGDTPQESLAAEFMRQAYADLHAWNTSGTNHNIICACWFVYDADQQSGGGWNGYSIEYWKNNGLPPSSPGDEYTAYTNAVSYHYPAGISGTLPEPASALVWLTFISGCIFRLRFTKGGLQHAAERENLQKRSTGARALQSPWRRLRRTANGGRVPRLAGGGILQKGATALATKSPAPPLRKGDCSSCRKQRREKICRTGLPARGFCLNLIHPRRKVVGVFRRDGAPARWLCNLPGGVCAVPPTAVEYPAWRGEGFCRRGRRQQQQNPPHPLYERGIAARHSNIQE